MSELKQCPFCGSEAQVNTWTMHGITESRCFCSNSDCPNSVRTVGLDQWNTRPIEDALNKRIAELEAAQRWIPVSERLPENENDQVLIRRGNVVALGWIYFDELMGDWDYRCYDEDWSGHPTHWMPLPTPPEVQE